MAVHPNSLANLKPWKPGQSGNPAGRPSYRDTFEHQIQRISEELDESECTNVEALARKAWELALAGNPVAFVPVLDRVWPKVSRHELEARISGSVEVTSDREWAELTRALDRLEPEAPRIPAKRSNGNGASRDSS